MNYESSIFQLQQVTGQETAGFWTLTLDQPEEKVNTLGQLVMQDFEKVLQVLEKKGAEGEVTGLVLISGKKENFIAGADIKLIQSIQTQQEAFDLSQKGQILLNRWEDLPFPTVAAIQGAALGGGCELALASSAIVMAHHTTTRIGLPEVLLGLIPGMGGTVRLPRKIGLAHALDLLLTGQSWSAEKAHKMGLAEAVLPSEGFLESVLRWMQKHEKALKVKQRLAPVPRLGSWGEVGGPVRSFIEKTLVSSMIFKKARDRVLLKTKGQYPAALEILDVIQNSEGGYGERLVGRARSEALERESQGFAKMAMTDVSKNLIRLFFLSEQVKKRSTSLQPAIQSAAVLGAGVMGGGIAQLLAGYDMMTRLKDLHTASLSLGIQYAVKIFKKNLKKKKINTRQFLQKINKIAPVLNYEGFGRVEIVIEAVVENLELKKKVFSEIESFVSSSTLLASNTSSLSVSQMQSGLQHPERVVGMHFFNPVHKMPLVEVVRGEQSAPEAIDRVFDFCKKLGKTPIVVKDSPGFLVNRILATYLNEAVYLVSEGVSILDIDRLLLSWGMPMGPLELIDEVGVDVGAKVSQILFQAFGDRFQPCGLNEKMIKAGRLGKKSSRGFYEYERLPEQQKHKVLDAQVYEVLEVHPREFETLNMSDQEIQERCLLPMINEASRCLDEKVIESPEQMDLGMIMGIGFPAFRGGLLRYADHLSAPHVVERLRYHEQKLGHRFQPSRALLARSDQGLRFYES